MEPIPSSPGPAKDSWADVLALPLGLLGAIIGGIAGAWLALLIAPHGLDSVIIVGVTTGFGTILLARRGGADLGIAAGLVALVAAIVAESKIFFFVEDRSLLYYVKHLHQVDPVHLLLIAAAGAAATWIAWTAPMKRKSISPPSV